jgi:hypothetical protein
LSDDALRALRDELQLAVDAAADHAAQAGVLSLEETKTYVYAS